MAQKKDVAAIVSGAGWIGSLACGIVTALRERGVSDKEIHSLVVDGGDLSVGRIADVLLEDIRNKNSTQLTPAVPGKFFMTVTLGTYPNVEDLKEAILSSGKKINGHVNQFLNKIEISSERIEVDLWEVSGFELGFSEDYLISTLYQRLCNSSFEKCSAEAIALSRIKCDDQKWRIGATKRIKNSHNRLNLLTFDSSNDIAWLSTSCADPWMFWRPAHVWILARRRPK